MNDLLKLISLLMFAVLIVAGLLCAAFVLYVACQIVTIL